MVITALAAQAMIRAVPSQDSEPLGGILNGVPGGLTGQIVLLGLIAPVVMVSGDRAHTRKEPATGRAGDPGEIRDRGTT